METIPSLSSLFIRFLKLGSTAYGGPAMIGQIRQTTVKGMRLAEGGRFSARIGLYPNDPRRHRAPDGRLCRVSTQGNSRRPGVHPGLSPPLVYDPCCSFDHIFQNADPLVQGSRSSKVSPQLWWPCVLVRASPSLSPYFAIGRLS